MANRRKDSKNRVLKEGESERKNGTYEYKYRDLSGKRKSAYAKTLEELREKEKEINRDLADGIISSDMTVYQIAEKYLSQKNNLRYNTMKCYQCALRIIENDTISSAKISKIKPMDMKMFFIRLHNEKGMKYQSINKVQKVLKPAFRMAFENDMIRKNPFCFSLSDVIEPDARKRGTITEKEMNLFLEFVNNHDKYKKYYNGIYILFNTGLRISELCGLTIRDVNMKEKIIHVNHQLCYGKRLYIESTKTDFGKRDLPMTEKVYLAFKAEIESRKSNEKIIDGYSGFIFLSKYGEPISGYTWDKRFKSILKSYNETHVVQMPKITPHVCRHTFCSNMAKAGMNPKALQYIMGHSNISITLDVYTHVGVLDAKKEMGKIENVV